MIFPASPRPQSNGNSFFKIAVFACLFEIKARFEKKSYKSAMYDDKKLGTYNELGCLNPGSSTKVDAG
jgi:hypothetical protein